MHIEKKSIISIVVVLALTLGLWGFNSSYKAREQAAMEAMAETMKQELYGDSTLAAGTYTAESQGFGGPVTVSLTLSETGIENVEIEGADETPTLGGAAIPILKDSIFANQNPYVDAISGATVTSKAVIEAAANAIEQAGADMETLRAKSGADVISSATESAGSDAISSATESAGSDATSSATESAGSDATSSATKGAGSDAISSATESTGGDAISSATKGKDGDATSSATKTSVPQADKPEEELN